MNENYFNRYQFQGLAKSVYDILKEKKEAYGIYESEKLPYSRKSKFKDEFHPFFGFQLEAIEYIGKDVGVRVQKIEDEPKNDFYILSIIDPITKPKNITPHPIVNLIQSYSHASDKNWLSYWLNKEGKLVCVIQEHKKPEERGAFDWVIKGQELHVARGGCPAVKKITQEDWEVLGLLLNKLTKELEINTIIKGHRIVEQD